MNRLEMAHHIYEKVSILKKRDEGLWKESEKLRKQFVKDYPVAKINKLTLDEYVIGKGSNNRSFCYRIEIELDRLGRILGARSDRFGIYFGKTKSDPKIKYRFAKKWGSDKDSAFFAVKQAIYSLLKAAEEENMAEINKNKISPLLKGKLLFIYFPEKFAPIYSKAHLEHFLSELNISGSFKAEAEMQKALMDYRSNWPDLKMQHACLYMRLLYDLLGYPSEDVEGEKSSTLNLPILSDAVRGARFIDEMPFSKSETKKRKGSSKNRNHVERHGRLKRTGDRGEAIVLELEKKRLKEAKRCDLAKKIDHVAARDDNAGFDILSYDEDGKERPIEVKSTTGSSLDGGFYISANEVEISGTLPNYYIYFVFNATKTNPEVLPWKSPKFPGKDFEMNPLVYHVTLPDR